MDYLTKKHFGYSVLGAAISAAVFFTASVFAQDTPRDIPQGGEQYGPNAEEIQQFEKEFGGPPESFPEPTIEKPQFEQPGTVPEEVKKYVSDKDLVAVYCAMTRWKSGQFFSVMDAVQKYVITPTEQIKSDFGIDFEIPNVASLKNEGLKRVQAICDSSTVSEAEKLAVDFADWGQNQNQAKFDSMRSEMQNQLKAKGDALREKVKTEIQPFIDEQKAGIEKEIKDSAQQVVDKKVAEIKDRLSGAESAPDKSALENEVTMAVESFIQSKIAQKKAEMQSKIQDRVQEIIGPEKAKFDKIGETFQNVSREINDYIKANESQYEQYKKQAFDLRKGLVLTILDKNMADGLAKLDAAEADLAEAKKNDPTVKSAAEMKAELQQDRQALAVKLDAALEAGDENAFQQALGDFRVKWETIQKDGEKAMQQSVSKVCTIALVQFDKANVQMEPGANKIKALQTKCANSVTDECLQINKFSSRFETIVSKFTDLKTEMSIASKICQNPETADRKNLIALMKKIQSDAEDVKVYGAALDADKTKVLADTVAAICGQALPQLQAAENEIKKNDLTVLQNNVDNCKGKTSEECKVVNGLTGDLAALKGKISVFEANVQKAKNLCSKSQSEEDFKTLSDFLNSLKSDGDVLRAAAQDLQVKQSQQMNEKTLCRAVVSQLEDAKQQIANGLAEMNYIKSGCAGKNDARCNVINQNSNKFDDLNNQAAQTLKKISDINTSCANASPDRLDQGLISALDGLNKDKDIFNKMIADLKSLEAQAGKGAGISFEAESAASFNTRTGVSNPMAREVNPRWRPPYFGDGDWYMGAGGDYLVYNFSAPKDGKYNVWVRDYVDNFQARGIRRIIMSFDGKNYGTFQENTSPLPADNRNGVLAWHQVGGGIVLKAGLHTMKVVKEATTRGAALLDSFYLTTGSEVPPEK